MPKGRFYLWLAVILLIGAAFRLYQLGQVPVSLYWDEVAILVDAKAIAATGQDMHGNSWLQAIFPSYGDYKLPVYIWLASISVKLAGISEWSLRLPSALAGIGTIFMSSAIAWQLFIHLKNRQREVIALCAAFTVAISPWSVLFSRTGFEGHLAQFLLSASVWMVLKSRANRWWLLGSVLFGSLATYSYYSVRFVWPIVFVAAVIFTLPVVKKDFWRQLITLLVAPLIVYAVSLLPIQRSPLYPASQQFRLSTVSVLNMADWPIESNTYKLQAGNTVFDKAVYHPLVLQARELAQNYADNMSFDFLFVSGDPNLRHGTGRHGLFLWPMFVPFIYGWYTILKKQWQQGLLLLVWWLAALLPASVPETTPHALRTLNALMPLSIVIGWGLYQLWEDVRQTAWPRWIKRGAVIAATVVMGLAVYDFARYYFLAYPTLSARDWQDRFKELAAETWQQSQTADVVWVEPFDNRFYLWLLAYEVPAEDFANIEFEHYMPKTIDSIRFRWFDWEKLPDLAENSTVVAEKEFLDQQLAGMTTRQPAWYKPMYTTDGLPRYAIVYFEKVE